MEYLGSDSFEKWLARYKLKFEDLVVKGCPAKIWSDFGREKQTPQALDLLCCMLKFDHSHRWTPQKLLSHAYFNS